MRKKDNELLAETYQQIQETHGVGERSRRRGEFPEHPPGAKISNEYPSLPKNSTMYIAYGKDRRSGIQIFGVFHSEKEAEQAIMDVDASWYPEDDNFVQIKPIPVGVYRDQPFIA